MSVLIKGMDELPDDGDFLVVRYENEKVYVKRVGILGYSMELVKLPKTYGDLIDRDELEKCVLKWLPPDPCGVEEREYPFETDICVSMLQEIEKQPTIIEAEGAEE